MSTKPTRPQGHVNAEADRVTQGTTSYVKGAGLRFWLPALCLVALAGLLLFWKLGATSFRDGDEATYAQCAREMLSRGDYLNILYRGEPFLEKPPLKIWLIALGYRLFGINELGARFSSALFALGTVAITILLGRRLFGATAGLLAGIILLSSVQFIHQHCGRTAELEPETTFLYLASMACLWLARRDCRWFYGLAATLGALVMTKGPVVIPALVTAAILLATERPRVKIAGRIAILSCLIFVAIAVPWHVYQLVVRGSAFRSAYLDAHILGRFFGNPPTGVSGNVVGITSQSAVAFYGPVVFHSLFPWSALLLPALAFQVWDTVRRRSDGARLLVAWIAVFALTIGISKGKLSWYIIPVLPALAISIAEFLPRLLGQRPRWLGFGLIAAAFAASLVFAPAPHYDPYAHRGMAWPGQDPDVLALWRLNPWTPAALAPAIVTLGLVAAAFGFRPRFRDLAPSRLRGALWVALVASLAFSAIYRTALPLGKVEHRAGAAACEDAVRAAGLHPQGLILLGTEAKKSALRAIDYFYLNDLSAGNILEPLRTGAFEADSALIERGALLLVDPRYRRALSKAGLGEPLWSEDSLAAFYAEGGAASGTIRRVMDWAALPPGAERMPGHETSRQDRRQLP